MATLLAEGPAAAREAARAGSHRQALAHYEAVIEHAALLDERARADVFHAYGWELYNAARFVDAVQAGRAAQRLYEALGDERALGLCLVRLSRLLLMAGATDEALAAAQRAVRLLGDNALRGPVPGRDPRADGAGRRRRCRCSSARTGSRSRPTGPISPRWS